MPRANPAYPRRNFAKKLSGWLELAMRSILSLEDLPSEIGVSYGTLRRSWINQDEIDSGQREGLTTQEKEELQRLRREVKTLRQEKEILPKALRPNQRPRKRSGVVSAFRLIDLRRGPATRLRCSMQDARSL